MILVRFRPIDEELNDLHTPLAVTLSEDDDENDVSLSVHGFWSRAYGIRVQHITY